MTQIEQVKQIEAPFAPPAFGPEMAAPPPSAGYWRAAYAASINVRMFVDALVEILVGIAEEPRQRQRPLPP